jgi:hypothetical protein
MLLTNRSEDSPLALFYRGVIGEPFFCLAAAASRPQSFLVIWHFVPAVSEILLRSKKQTYSALPFYLNCIQFDHQSVVLYY